MCHLITEPRWKWRPSSSQKVWDLSLAGGVAEMLSLKLKLKLIITHVSNQSAMIAVVSETPCRAHGSPELQLQSCGSGSGQGKSLLKMKQDQRNKLPATND